VVGGWLLFNWYTGLGILVFVPVVAIFMIVGGIFAIIASFFAGKAGVPDAAPVAPTPKAEEKPPAATPPSEPAP
jgi:hypothetical protein